MDLRRSVPAVLVLALVVPPAALRSGAAARGSIAEAPRVQQAGSARPRRAGEISAATIGLAGDYLRSRAAGTNPSSQAKAAWEEFYGWCDPVIRRFAGTFRARGVDVEDCTQEVWSDLMLSLPALTLDQSRGRFTSWLYAIVRSNATDLIRRKLRRPTVVLSAAIEAQLGVSDGDPARLFEREAERERITTALSTLRNRSSELNYRVLHLRCLEGCRVSEVAERLGLSSEQVWAREHRMKRKLRDLLAGVGSNRDRADVDRRRALGQRT